MSELSEPFTSEHLTREQIDEAYKTALRQVELQRLQARMHLAMKPDDKQRQAACAGLTRDLRALEADYAAWQKAHPAETGSSLSGEPVERR